MYWYIDIRRWIYGWVHDQKMVINPKKIEWICFEKLLIEQEAYTKPDDTKIKKDLGVIFESTGGFRPI